MYKREGKINLGIFVVRFIEILEIKQDPAQGLNFIRQLQYPHWFMRVRGGLSLIHI